MPGFVPSSALVFSTAVPWPQELWSWSKWWVIGLLSLVLVVSLLMGGWSLWQKPPIARLRRRIARVGLGRWGAVLLGLLFLVAFLGMFFSPMLHGSAKMWWEAIGRLSGLFAVGLVVIAATQQKHIRYSLRWLQQRLQLVEFSPADQSLFAYILLLGVTGVAAIWSLPPSWMFLWPWGLRILLLLVFALILLVLSRQAHVRRVFQAMEKSWALMGWSQEERVWFACIAWSILVLFFLRWVMPAGMEPLLSIGLRWCWAGLVLAFVWAMARRWLFPALAALWDHWKPSLHWEEAEQGMVTSLFWLAGLSLLLRLADPALFSSLAPLLSVLAVGLIVILAGKLFVRQKLTSQWKEWLDNQSVEMTEEEHRFVRFLLLLALVLGGLLLWLPATFGLVARWGLRVELVLLGLLGLQWLLRQQRSQEGLETVRGWGDSLALTPADRSFLVALSWIALVSLGLLLLLPPNWSFVAVVLLRVETLFLGGWFVSLLQRQPLFKTAVSSLETSLQQWGWSEVESGWCRLWMWGTAAVVLVALAFSSLATGLLFFWSVLSLLFGLVLGVMLLWNHGWLREQVEQFWNWREQQKEQQQDTIRALEQSREELVESRVALLQNQEQLKTSHQHLTTNQEQLAESQKQLLDCRELLESCRVSLLQGQEQFGEGQTRLEQSLEELAESRHALQEQQQAVQEQLEQTQQTVQEKLGLSRQTVQEQLEQSQQTVLELLEQSRSQLVSQQEEFLSRHSREFQQEILLHWQEREAEREKSYQERWQLLQEGWTDERRQLEENLRVIELQAQSWEEWRESLQREREKLLEQQDTLLSEQQHVKQLVEQGVQALQAIGGWPERLRLWWRERVQATEIVVNPWKDRAASRLRDDRTFWTQSWGQWRQRLPLVSLNEYERRFAGVLLSTALWLGLALIVLPNSASEVLMWGFRAELGLGGLLLLFVVSRQVVVTGWIAKLRSWVGLIELEEEEQKLLFALTWGFLFLSVAVVVVPGTYQKALFWIERVLLLSFVFLCWNLLTRQQHFFYLRSVWQNWMNACIWLPGDHSWVRLFGWAGLVLGGALWLLPLPDKQWMWIALRVDLVLLWLWLVEFCMREMHINRFLGYFLGSSVTTRPRPETTQLWICRGVLLWLGGTGTFFGLGWEAMFWTWQGLGFVSLLGILFVNLSTLQNWFVGYWMQKRGLLHLQEQVRLGDWEGRICRLNPTCCELETGDGLKVQLPYLRFHKEGFVSISRVEFRALTLQVFLDPGSFEPEILKERLGEWVQSLDGLSTLRRSQVVLGACDERGQKLELYLYLQPQQWVLQHRQLPGMLMDKLGEEEAKLGIPQSSVVVWKNEERSPQDETSRN